MIRPIVSIPIDFASFFRIFTRGRGFYSFFSINPVDSLVGYTCSEKHIITGDPDIKKVSTSHVERQNLTMRMGMRRFTRLTNGFSKKVFNLECAVALHFMHYNFGRIHKTLHVTPAMEAGISDRVWSLVEIAALAE